MTEAQMKAEITKLRALLARVAGETGIHEINGWQSRGKPISLKLYDEVTSAIWNNDVLPV